MFCHLLSHNIDFNKSRPWYCWRKCLLWPSCVDREYFYGLYRLSLIKWILCCQIIQQLNSSTVHGGYLFLQANLFNTFLFLSQVRPIFNALLKAVPKVFPGSCLQTSMIVWDQAIVQVKTNSADDQLLDSLEDINSFIISVPTILQNKLFCKYHSIEEKASE